MRTKRRLATDHEWLALDAPAARRTAAEINTERARGELAGPPIVTGGQLLAASVLRVVARRLVEIGLPDAEAEIAPAEAGTGVMDSGPASRTGRRQPAKPLVDRLVLDLLGNDPATPILRDLLEPAASPANLGPAARRLLQSLPGEAPESLVGRLLWIREQWPHLLEPRSEVEPRLLLAADLVAEEARALHQLHSAREIAAGTAGGRATVDGTATPAPATGGHGPAEGPDYRGLDAEPERFSSDMDWMPEVVLQAKSTYVWLDQLSRRHRRDIRTLDGIPDEELDRLASWGVTGLWLIGVWQRSTASAAIKHRRGNPDAVASAYSLDDYRIADDLGGEAAYADLRDRASARGIRLASDMVPNHMGLDSHWVIEHPERFLSVPTSPYPSYNFSGPDLSPDPAVAIRLEDHYWDASDAAVVFQRSDTRTGETRYVYHGNDGTSFPWNDTAQLD
ncbi:MAG: Alpha-amylase, partial [Chloroflexi bacterium]|nr:Alpha-amylase [Chloroflexota bacterium]